MTPMRMPAARAALRRLRLLVGDPLQPHVERDAVGQLRAQLRDEGRSDVARRGRPLVARAPAAA